MIFKINTSDTLARKVPEKQTILGYVSTSFFNNIAEREAIINTNY